MAIVKISCPQCKHRFTLKAPNPAALAAKPFKCPKCGMSTPFSRILGITPNAASLHTHIAGLPGNFNGGKTCISGSQVKVNLRLEKENKTFSIGNGTYILGRDSSDSRATIKLAPDPYMSRQHAQLSINSMNGQPVCKLTSMSSANAVFVNTQRLASGETVNLKNHDAILLGMTTIIIEY